MYLLCLQSPQRPKYMMLTGGATSKENRKAHKNPGGGGQPMIISRVENAPVLLKYLKKTRLRKQAVIYKKISIF